MAKPLYQKEIPSSDPHNPTPVQLTLHSDGREEEGKFGPQYLYEVTYEGQERTLYASKGLSRSIEETMASSGDTISIVRTGQGKETRWSTVLASQDLTGVSKDNTIGGEPAPQAQTAREHPRDKWVKDLKRYRIAWKKAKSFLEGEGDEGDLNAIAFTFYRMAKDAGFDLLELEKEGEEGEL